MPTCHDISEPAHLLRDDVENWGRTGASKAIAGGGGAYLGKGLVCLLPPAMASLAAVFKMISFRRIARGVVGCN